MTLQQILEYVQECYSDIDPERNSWTISTNAVVFVFKHTAILKIFASNGDSFVVRGISTKNTNAPIATIETQYSRSRTKLIQIIENEIDKASRSYNRIAELIDLTKIEQYLTNKPAELYKVIFNSKQPKSISFCMSSFTVDVTATHSLEQVVFEYKTTIHKLPNIVVMGRSDNLGQLVEQQYSTFLSKLNDELKMADIVLAGYDKMQSETNAKIAFKKFL